MKQNAPIHIREAINMSMEPSQRGQIRRAFIFIAAFIAICAVTSSCGGQRSGHERRCDEYSEAELVGTENDYLAELVTPRHEWRKVPREEFLCGNPSKRQINEWENLCESIFKPEPTERRHVEGCFKDHRHYVAVNDLIELWYGPSSGDYQENDDLTLWRIAQLDSVPRHPKSLDERLILLKDRIDRLLDYNAGAQWEINMQSALRADLKEFYSKTLLRAYAEDSPRSLSPTMIQDLEQEADAYQAYHDTLVSAYRKLKDSPDGWSGSAWPMAVNGLSEDDSDLWVWTLESQLLNWNQTEHHESVLLRKVAEEYRKFASSLTEDEHSYPLRERKEALDRDRRAFEAWMLVRDKISETLEGEERARYEENSNNIRRHKLIMLKNRYEGFGIESESFLSCLIPYSIPDAALDTSSFEENLERLVSK